MKVQKKRATLLVTVRPDRIHPLHLILGVSDAKRLDICSGEKLTFLSVTAKRYEVFSSSNPVTPFTTDTPSSNASSDDMSKFFPDKPKRTPFFSLQSSDTDDVQVVAHTWIDDEFIKEITELENESLENDAIPGIGSVDSTDGDTITVYCSPDFLAHYQISPNEDIYIKTTMIYPIQKLVIGVTDFSAFKWLKKVKFSAGLLTEVCKNEVLIRANDIFLASYPDMFLEDPSFRTSMYFDMHVLESCPLQTGNLTVNTQLVISLIEDPEEDDNSLEMRLDSPTQLNTRSLDHFLISDFCQALKPDVLALNAKTIGLSQRSFSSSQLFGYETIQQHSSWKKLFSKTQRKHSFDSLYVIGMTKSTMIQNGFFEESIVEVSLGDPTHSTSLVLSSRLAQVKCISQDIGNFSKVYISPLLLFNLQNANSVRVSSKSLRIQKYNTEGTNIDLGTASVSWKANLPVAREVHISIVTSPYYSPRAIQTEAIKTYFMVPRLVTKGDILPFRSKDDPEYAHALTDSDKRNPVVFFKVVKVDGPQTAVPCYICDQHSTRLVQVGSVHSYIPVQMISYLSHDALTYWDQTYLHGMNRYADKLELLITPHLQHKLDNPSLKEVLPSIMLTGPSGCGKTTVAVTVARRLNLHIYKVNCHSLYGEASGAIEARIKNVFNAASTYSPCVLFLHSIHALAKDKERNTEDPRVASSFKQIISQLKNEYLEFPVIVIGTTHSSNNLATDVQEAFLHEVQIEVPNEVDRQEMLDGLLQNISYSGDVSGHYLAQRTAGFVLGDMAALVAHAKRETYQRVYKLCAGERKLLSYEEEEDICEAGIVLQQEDFVRALDRLQAAHSDSIGAPKIPSVTWDDVGGLADVKSDILDTIQLPLQYPELLAAGLRRSGVLLYGPPGTGKTLLAKAVATECSLNFLSVKGPELINMYVGQSEENVREVFHRARSATPCVIFFDELDSLAPNRGKSGDSGGVMDRVVSQLLAELDGLHKSCDVFVIGATNRPDLLDPALLRPGRFDKMLYLGISEDNDSQLKIIKALTRRFKMSDNLDLQNVVDKCPKNLTGADLYALCSDAMLNAMKLKIHQLEIGETTDQTNVIVTEEDFMAALDTLTPSVSSKELQRYNELKAFFTGKR